MDKYVNVNLGPLTLQMKFHSTTKCRLDQEKQTATFALNGRKAREFRFFSPRRDSFRSMKTCVGCGYVLERPVVESWAPLHWKNSWRADPVGTAIGSSRSPRASSRAILVAGRPTVVAMTNDTLSVTMMINQSREKGKQNHIYHTLFTAPSSCRVLIGSNHQVKSRTPIASSLKHQLVENHFFSVVGVQVRMWWE